MTKSHLLALGFTALLTAAPALAHALQPIRIVVVGDSTTARRSGYGDGFCAQWKPEVTCIEDGVGGASTKSTRATGFWDNKVMPVLKTPTGAGGQTFARTYVLMQFGTNDSSMAPQNHADAQTDFRANLTAFATETKSTGATFILVTPLTMRNFTNGHLDPGRIAPYAEATRATAEADHLPVLDLYAESQKAVQAMGPVKANHDLAGAPIPPNVLATEASGTSVQPQKIDPPQSPGAAISPFDYIHLGQATGGPYFGKMVAGMLVKAQPELAAYLK